MIGMDKVWLWVGKDAKWWQFWMVQSGFVGGVISGVLVVILFYVIRFFG